MLKEKAFALNMIDGTLVLCLPNCQPVNKKKCIDEWTKPATRWMASTKTMALSAQHYQIYINKIYNEGDMLRAYKDIWLLADHR